jgi:hypothetical protein
VETILHRTYDDCVLHEWKGEHLLPVYVCDPPGTLNAYIPWFVPAERLRTLQHQLTVHFKPRHLRLVLVHDAPKTRMFGDWFDAYPQETPDAPA